MHSQNFKHLFHLDPAPDGAAGGAADSSLPANDAAPAFDASKFVPREELESLRSEYGDFRSQAEQRFQDYDSRLPKSEKQEVKADKAPSPADYDFSKEGQFEAFLDARNQYNFKIQRKEWETEQAQTQSKQEYDASVQKALSDHGSRMDAYKAVNPDYDPYKNITIPHTGVTLEILNSEYSANIHHFLQKNPEKLKELRGLSQSNPAAAVRMVGRMEGMFEKQETAIPGKQKAASASTTADAFGGKSSGGRTKSTKEIYDEWHK